MDERAKVAWLARRAGFGPAPGELDARAATGAAAWLDELVDPDAHEVPGAPDPWAGADLAFTNDAASRRSRALDLIGRWLTHMATTPRPLEEAMVWFWHDHFAVSLAEVRSAAAMADHLRLLRRHALGDFRTLIREVATDPAMLVFLDGARSTGQAPNENFGRELLELYTLGVGNYGEADVRAGAVALTGWTVDLQRGGGARFVPRRHDDRPQAMLGRQVHDVDSVVDAAVSHPACATFVSRKLVAWFLGTPADEQVVAAGARAFTASGMSVRALVRTILAAGLDGAGHPVVRAPVPWLVGAARAVGASVDARALYAPLTAAGQVPCLPPNVGGWPGETAWLGASATVARVSMAALLVDALAADAEPLRLAAAKDLAALAARLGLPAGFTPATADALRAMPATGPRPGASVLAVALASPDLLLG